VCIAWKAFDDHAKRHAASATHPRRGGEEEVNGEGGAGDE
jgi:hypothetical protein